MEDFKMNQKWSGAQKLQDCRTSSRTEPVVNTNTGEEDTRDGTAALADRVLALPPGQSTSCSSSPRQQVDEESEREREREREICTHIIVILGYIVRGPPPLSLQGGPGIFSYANRLWAHCSNEN